jgi:hypothetical protein
VTDAPTNLYQKARSDVCGMLGYDLDNLSAEQSVRVDVATALRVLLDNQSSRLVKGETLDARELLMASDALSRLLPPLREPPSEPREDPRAVMFRIYMEMRSRGEVPPEGHFQHRINELEAENAQLRAALGVAPALPECRYGLPDALAGHSTGGRGSAAITPAEADVVPPSEIGHAIVGKVAGPDDPKPGPVIEGKASAARPSRQQDWDSTPNGVAWNEWRNAGGAHYDRWANRND